jgi:uncharacterized protein (TIGR00725 family)
MGWTSMSDSATFPTSTPSTFPDRETAPMRLPPPTPGHLGPLIAVCGASAASAEESDVAFHVGRLLAARDAIVVCGGLGGVMEGVCRGVSKAGGISIGLLPGDDPAAANPFVTLAVPTGLGELRNGLIARSCRAMIAIGGGWGTLSEVGLMLRLGRPVCAIRSWELIPPGGAIDAVPVHRAADAEGAVAWVLGRI